MASPSFSFSPQNNLAFLGQGDVILFQGDSITDGGRLRVGDDGNRLMGQAYGYIIAAQAGAKYPERNLTFINRGINGNKVADLAGRWREDTLELKPNVLSILVGINDTMGNVSVEQYEQSYDRLLAETLAALRGVKIILGEPFLLPGGRFKDDYEAHRAEVKKRQGVVAGLAQKYHLPVIHYQKAFDEACLRAPAAYWAWDGVHPTYAGHGVMAEEWMRTVDAFRSQG